MTEAAADPSSSSAASAPAPSPAAVAVLRGLYAAFNARDIDAALAGMTPDVTWPRAFLGGFVQGHAAIREYWTHQWAEINPRVEPVGFSQTPDGRVAVDVHQVVRDLGGAVVADGRVVHVYAFAGDKVSGMDLPA